MPVVTMMVHPKGLHPLQAAKAWNKHKEEGMSLNSILTEALELQAGVVLSGFYVLFVSDI